MNSCTHLPFITLIKRDRRMTLFFTLLLILVLPSCQEEEPSPPLSSAFSISQSEGNVPFTVKFSSGDNGAVDRLWEILDSSGLTYYTIPNPVHTYYDTGVFGVTLYTYGSDGSTSKTASYVVVNKPITDFSIIQNSDFAPSKIEFSNLTQWTSDVSFDFGNGDTSKDTNPFALYSEPGTYDVTLTAKGTIAKGTIYEKLWDIKVTKSVTIKEEPTKVVISKIELTNFPEKQPDGSEWEAGSGPNIFARLIEASSGNELWKSTTIFDFKSTNLPKVFEQVDYTVDELSKKYAIELMHEGSTSTIWMGGYYFLGEDWKSIDGSPYPSQITLAYPDKELEFKVDLVWLP